MHPLRAIALVPLLLGAASAQSKNEAKEWAEALRVAPTWLWGPEKARADVRKALADRGLLDRPLTKAQSAQLLEKLAAGNPFLTDKTNSGTLELPTDKPEQKAKVWFQLTPGYKPGQKPVGLVIAMHGGPAPDWKTAHETAPQEHSYWTSAAAKHGLVCASPGWVGDPGPLVIELVETCAKRWNIDRNRVYMVGHSAGGVASFMVGPAWSDRFAGIAPFVCGMEHGDRLDNAWNFAVYHVLGKKDNAFFLSTGRKNSERLKTVGGTLQVVEKDGGHDVFPDECDKSLAWLVARPRKFWSKDVRWRPDEARKAGGFLWVDPGAASPPAKFTAKVEGNEIRIEGHRPSEIVLSDALVDLDQPVTVLVNGESAFNAKVDRTLRTALEWIERTGDFSAVPVARVALSR